MDSHNRLFGEVERPYTPAKNHFKSSIPLGGADSVDSTPRTNGTNGKTNGTNGHTNGNSNGEAMIANGNSVKHGKSSLLPILRPLVFLVELKWSPLNLGWAILGYKRTNHKHAFNTLYLTLW